VGPEGLEPPLHRLKGEYASITSRARSRAPRAAFVSYSSSLSRRLVYCDLFDSALYPLFDSPFDLFCIDSDFDFYRCGREELNLHRKTGGLQPLELADAQRPHTRVLPRSQARGEAGRLRAP
jgi:hypothetical protein